jgi:hypothetical protein
MSQTRCYATLAELRKRLDRTDDKVSDDERYLEKLRAATNFIERMTSRIFEPVKASNKFDWHSPSVLLFTRIDLLSLTSVTDSNGTVDTSDAVLLGNGPYYGIEFDPTTSYLAYNTTPTKAITVAGVWGWHDDYDSAWLDSLDALVESVNSSVKLIKVASATASDAYGRSNRFSAGRLIRVDTEYLRVVSVDTSTSDYHTLTVERGVNGTTAAAHDADTAIDSYTPSLVIRETCLQLAAYLAASDDTDYGKITILGNGDKEIPLAWPKNVRETLAALRYVRV